MEFIDLTDASEEEIKEIERILSRKCSSLEFPFECPKSAPIKSEDGRVEINNVQMPFVPITSYANVYEHKENYYCGTIYPQSKDEVKVPILGSYEIDNECIDDRQLSFPITYTHPGPYIAPTYIPSPTATFPTPAHMVPIPMYPFSVPFYQMPHLQPSVTNGRPPYMINDGRSYDKKAGPYQKTFENIEEEKTEKEEEKKVEVNGISEDKEKEEIDGESNQNNNKEDNKEEDKLENCKTDEEHENKEEQDDKAEKKTEENSVDVEITNGSKERINQRSWADLLRGSNGESNSVASNTNNYNTSYDGQLGEDKNREDPRYVLLQQDVIAIKIAKRLNEINLKHSLPYLIPRGLVNRGNWCYINATLQALLYCPPFYNLMRELGEIPGICREKSSTPIIDSFVKFFSNFLPSEPLQRKGKYSNGFEDVAKGEPLEPVCIYDVLCLITSECLKGRQEDAEEYLSSVLNGLHEEMIRILKVDVKSNGQEDGGVWNVVGYKNRTLPTRSAKIINSPIVDIFGGSMISVRTAGADKCGNKQPFFTLQLDIQSDNIKSVDDALRSLTLREWIQGFTCAKTKQTIDASHQCFLDHLPPILILHLKLFVYDKDGGSKKLVKKIDYPIDLELPRECLHMDRDKNKFSKSYKLLSVVYHDGAESVKGHYLTDIFHIGSGNWLRCDDNNIKTISVYQLLNPTKPRVPYLLFYRRCDTLRSNSNTSRSNSHH